MRTRILAVIALLALPSCGTRVPEFQSPQNGQTVNIPSNGAGNIQIILSASDLNDSSVAIEVHAPSSLTGRYQCTASGPFGQCYDMSGQAQYGNQPTTYRNCSCQTPCVDQIAITARRGTSERTVFLSVRDTGVPCQ